jgi:superfamily II DNA or RNA helicase
MRTEPVRVSKMAERALVPAHRVLALFANAVLGRDVEATKRVGDLSLRPHQEDAVRRLRRHIARHGGALLADEVGLGKTYVALALMREARSPVVVAPASLRPMWTQALARAGLAAPLVSFESLSRGRSVATRPDLLVVDEAHHARTTSTRRYATLAALAAGVRTLLLSATPIHNQRRDLASLLALFLGDAAHSFDERALARHIVRHTRDDVSSSVTDARLPLLEAPHWLSLPEEADILDAILALPPPVPPSDGGDGGALVTYTLVRQWASSRGALRGALRRRLAMASALSDAFAAGRTPTRTELSAWNHADGVVQLAFPELVAAATAEAPTPDLSCAVDAHAVGVRALLATLASTFDPDSARADALRMLRRSHAGEKIVAFTERAETVAALYSQLRTDAGVAALTAEGGRVVGGRCSRSDIVERFAPAACGVAPPSRAEEITLLLATDLLSEGVSLQDASVVVHLDLPWSPARLEQRVGRVRRLGSLHERVHVYVMPPPAPADRLLEVERRLRRKMSVAGRAVGVAGAVLPSIAGRSDIPDSVAEARDRSDAEELTRLRADLLPFRDDSEENMVSSPLVAVSLSRRRGALALVSEDDETRLIASLDGAAFTDDACIVRRALAAMVPAVTVMTGDVWPAVDVALSEVGRWLRERAGASLACLSMPVTARARRRVLERLSAIGSNAPRHRRAPLAPLMAEARRAAVAPLGVGAERVLEALASVPMDDEGWLRAVATFGRLHSPGGALARDRHEGPSLVALLVLVD